MPIQVRIDTRDAALAVFALGDAMPRVGARALNRVVQRERTLLRRAISGASGIPVRRVSPTVTMQRATPQTLESRLQVGRRRFPLILFGPPLRAAGMQRAGQPLAFEQIMPSGHRGIFQRRGRPRLPIVELRATLTEALGAELDGIMQTRAAAIAAALGPQLSHEVERAIARKAIY